MCRLANLNLLSILLESSLPTVTTTASSNRAKRAGEYRPSGVKEASPRKQKLGDVAHDSVSEYSFTSTLQFSWKSGLACVN